MREVIERLTCNIGGESVLSDEDNLLTINEETFVWGGVTYTLDVCGKCRSKMMRLSITDLINKSVRVTPAKKAPAKKRSGKDIPSADKWAEYKVGDFYVCPTDKWSSDNPRAFGQHMGQRHKDSKPLKKVS